MKKILKLGDVSGKHFFRHRLDKFSKLEGLKLPPYLADYEDMLSLQWVSVVQKICPTDGLGGFLAGPARNIIITSW